MGIICSRILGALGRRFGREAEENGVPCDDPPASEETDIAEEGSHLPGAPEEPADPSEGSVTPGADDPPTHAPQGPATPEGHVLSLDPLLNAGVPEGSTYEEPQESDDSAAPFDDTERDHTERDIVDIEDGESDPEELERMPDPESDDSEDQHDPEESDDSRAPIDHTDRDNPKRDTEDSKDGVSKEPEGILADEESDDSTSSIDNPDRDTEDLEDEGSHPKEPEGMTDPDESDDSTDHNPECDTEDPEDAASHPMDQDDYQDDEEPRESVIDDPQMCDIDGLIHESVTTDEDQEQDDEAPLTSEVSGDASATNSPVEDPDPIDTEDDTDPDLENPDHDYQKTEELTYIEGEERGTTNETSGSSNLDKPQATVDNQNQDAHEPENPQEINPKIVHLLEDAEESEIHFKIRINLDTLQFTGFVEINEVQNPEKQTDAPDLEDETDPEEPQRDIENTCSSPHLASDPSIESIQLIQFSSSSETLYPQKPDETRDLADSPIQENQSIGEIYTQDQPMVPIDFCDTNQMTTVQNPDYLSAPDAQVKDEGSELKILIVELEEIGTSDPQMADDLEDIDVKDIKDLEVPEGMPDPRMTENLEPNDLQTDKAPEVGPVDTDELFGGFDPHVDEKPMGPDRATNPQDKDGRTGLNEVPVNLKDQGLDIESKEPKKATSPLDEDNDVLEDQVPKELSPYKDPEDGRIESHLDEPKGPDKGKVPLETKVPTGLYDVPDVKSEEPERIGKNQEPDKPDGMMESKLEPLDPQETKVLTGLHDVKDKEPEEIGEDQDPDDDRKMSDTDGRMESQLDNKPKRQDNKTKIPTRLDDVKDTGPPEDKDPNDGPWKMSDPDMDEKSAGDKKESLMQDDEATTGPVKPKEPVGMSQQMMTEGVNKEVNEDFEKGVEKNLDEIVTVATEGLGYMHGSYDDANPNKKAKIGCFSGIFKKTKKNESKTKKTKNGYQSLEENEEMENSQMENTEGLDKLEERIDIAKGEEKKKKKGLKKRVIQIVTFSKVRKMIKGKPSKSDG